MAMTMNVVKKEMQDDGELVTGTKRLIHTKKEDAKETQIMAQIEKIPQINQNADLFA